MTDDDKALVKRLRAGCLPMKHDAADRIEAQAAEIARLREALGELSGNTGKLPIWENENG